VELSNTALPTRRVAASVPGWGSAAVAMVAITFSLSRSMTETSREFSLAT
jgi:hypothetical protein